MRGRGGSIARRRTILLRLLLLLLLVWMLLISRLLLSANLSYLLGVMQSALVNNTRTAVSLAR